MNIAAAQVRPLVWNDAAILEAMGRSPELAKDLLRRNGQPLPSDQAVYQWVSRKRLPDRWRPKIIYALMREQKIDVGRLFKVSAGKSAAN